MNERRRILDDGSGGNVVTLRVTTTDGSTNVGIEMVVTNGNNVYPVTTDSQGKVEMTGLSGGCTIDCETYEISVHEFIATGTMTVDISAYVNSFPVGETRSFNYTGAVSEVQLIPGSYKLQVWGAQGGTYSSYTGGKGGYSEGILTLLQALKVYVFVGGQGSRSGNGGWNGGGGTSGSASYSSSGTSGSSYMACGGGGTDIALVTSSMAYSSYRTNRSSESLLSRIIVAGGGSGGAYTTRSETTSTTTWESFASGNSGGPHTWAPDIVYNSFNIQGAKVGDTYRFKCTKKTSGTSTFFVYFIQDSNYQTISSGNWSYGSWVTITVPSNCHQIATQTGNNTGDTSKVPDTYSCVFEHKTTTSSTTTTSDYAYGYVGGGTSGGGSYPGSQSSAGSGGAFGLGANQTITYYRHCAACGGGGWYGGGGGSYSDSSKTYVKYSGGGSGFVNIAANASYRPSGYTGIELDSGTTYTGSTYFPNTAGTGTEYGHSGNGYAKITRFAAYTITLIVKDEDNLPVEGASLTVANSENTYSLTTDSNGEATTAMINGTYNLSCLGYSLNPSQITVSSNATIDIVAAAPSIMDFSYTGAVQNTILKAGTYKIECWGAQGGYRSNTTYGGKGGYSVGELTLSQNTNIYVYVGGSGNTGGTSGGFNGGGIRATYAGGGGGSDVRIGQDSLYARVIVAGGGGSDGATSKHGMYGGGTTGGTTTESYGTGGGGGTQTSGGTGSSSASGSGTSGTYGAFGVGGRGYAASNGYAGAGGGGWYGGAGSYPDGSGDDDRGGGGGSGYVYNSSTASSYPSGCLLNSSHYLANSQTIAGNASMPSTSGGTETGHSGNGFIRITKI